MVILKCNLNYVDSNDKGETLKSRATRTTISFSIMPIFFVVLTRFFEGLSMLEAMWKQGLCFPRLRADKIKAFIVDMLFEFGTGRAMAPGATSIYLTDTREKRLRVVLASVLIAF